MCTFNLTILTKFFLSSCQVKVTTKETTYTVIFIYLEPWHLV